MRNLAPMLLVLLVSACDRDEPSLRAPAPPCPARMAPVGSFCIDRHEATIVRGRAVPALDTTPAVGVSYVDADRACRAAGARLCSEEEWSRACEGLPPVRRLPYGDTWEPHRCNAAEWDDPPDRPLAPSGSFERCVTPEGVFDLSGNVWEWTTGLDRSGTLRELRGGSVHNGEGNAVCRPNDGLFLAPEIDEGLLGFRCCAPARSTRRTTE